MAAYFPYTQHIQYFGNFSVRSTGSREVLIPAVRHAIAQVNLWPYRQMALSSPR
jgi:hypothetical protein